VPDAFRMNACSDVVVLCADEATWFPAASETYRSKSFAESVQLIVTEAPPAALDQ
jgi:hypothetical protein